MTKEIELGVLGALIQFPQAFPKITGILTRDDFYVDAHKIIFEKIVDLRKEGKVVDGLVLKTALPEMMGIIDGTYNYCPVSIQLVDSYIEVVRENSLKNKIKLSAMEILNNLKDNSFENIKEIIERLPKLLSMNHKNYFVSMGVVMQELNAIFDLIIKNKGRHLGLQAGFPRLNSKSPLMPKDYVLLGGSPNIGKTALALTILLNVAQAEKKPVALFSCEMSKEEIGLRLISIESGITLTDLRHGRFDSDRLTKTQSRIYNERIFIDDDGGLDINELSRRAERFKIENPGLCLIVVDHIGFVKTERKETKQQEVADVSAGLKSLAKRLNVCMLVLTQLVKEAQGRIPSMIDIRDSGAPSQDADAIWLLWRDKDKAPDKAKIFIAKQRNGESGIFSELKFIADRTLFYED